MNTLNIAMFLEHSARRSPDQTFLICGEQRLTFRQVETAARRFAQVLAGLGVKAGERVALLLPNVPALPICTYGALKRGAVVVPIDVTAPAPEIAYFLDDSEATVLVALESLVEAAIGGFQAAEGCQHLILANPLALERSEGWADSAVCPPPARRLAELMAAASGEFQTAATRPEDAAVILYTAGTAGRLKGAILSHFNYYFFTQLLTQDLWRIGPDDVIMMIAPGSHIFGQAILNVACAAQAKLSLMAKPDMEAFLYTLAQDQVTFLAGVPTLGYYMLHSPLTDQYDLSSLRLVMFSGAPLSPELAEQFRQRFGVDLITGYGLTEAVPVTFVTADMKDVPPASVGTPVWGTSVRIVDETGCELPLGESGEVVVRGPQVFSGYYHRPRATAKALRDGWLHTGDVGYLNEAGHLFLVDRLNDRIKRGGYSVFPAEVERVLYAHPAVAEAAVIGVPDEALGEEVKAFVALKPGTTATADELIRHCKAQLSAYKYPRLVEFRDSLPKDQAGKVWRRSLRPERVPH